MNLLELLQTKNFNVSTKMEPFTNIKENFEWGIDGYVFSMNISLHSDGSLNIRVDTALSSFTRTFGISYYEFMSKDKKFRTNLDFSLNVNTESDDFLAIITMSKFNIMMAEFFDSLVKNEEFLDTLKLNFNAHYEESVKRDAIKKEEKALRLEENKKSFFEEYSFLDDETIKTALKDLRENPVNNKIVFAICHTNFTTYYLHLFYKNNSLHVIKNDDKDIESVLRYRSDKVLVRDLKEVLKRAYKII